MKSKIFKVLALLVLCLGAAVAFIMLSFMSDEEQVPPANASKSATKARESIKIDNVVRIFMHERGYYTFFSRVKSGPGHRIKITSIRLTRTDEKSKEKIIEDVPEGRESWAEASPPWKQNNRLHKWLIIHVHSVKEINGAGWNHGKFGRGKTIVIE